MKTLLAALTLLAGFAVHPAAAAATREVWVTPGGDDHARGTQQHPLRTPQAGVDRLARIGGVVHLRGTFHRQRILVTHAHGLTVEGVPGHTTLDETGLTPRDGDSGAVQIEDSRQVEVSGLDVTGYRTTSLAKVPIGIYVTGSGSGITLRGNHVHDLGNDNRTLGSFDINAHGIAVYGRDPAHPIDGLRIEGNEVDHLHLGASEAVVVNGNVDGWAITGNRIHDVDNIGIDAIGYEQTLTGSRRYTQANRARHGRISGNTVDGVVSRGNPAYWEDGEWCNCADGIYVDGGTGIDIRDNVVRRSDIGLEVGAENPRGHTDHVRVTGNDVAGSAYVGLALGGYDPKRGEVYAVTVAGNRFRDDNSLDDGSPELLLQFKLHQVTVTGNHVTVGHPQTPLALKRVREVGTPAQNADVLLDRNDYGGDVTAPRALFTWLGRTVTGFAAYQRTSGQDTHSTWTRR